MTRSFGQLSGAVAKVYLDGTRVLAKSPPVVIVHQGEFTHEILEFEFRPSTMASSSFASGALIAVRYGLSTPGGTRMFVGYVNHSQPLYRQGELGQHRIRVVCVGPTFQMKSASQQTFANMGLDAVLKKLAKGYRLNVKTAPLSYVWSSIAQHGQTDWEFACKVAKQAGYSLVPDGTTLLAQPRNVQTLQSRIARSVPVLTTADVGNGSLMEFKPLMGAEAPSGGERRTRQAAGVDALTGKPIYSQKTPASSGLAASAPQPLFTGITATLPVRSMGEMTAALQGIDGDNAMYQEATLRTWGDVSLKPGGLIFVHGTSRNTDGYWYVKETCHELAMGSEPLYTVDATVCRDSVGPSATPRLPQITPTTSPSGSDLSPPATLVGGQWVSASGTP